MPEQSLLNTCIFFRKHITTFLCSEHQTALCLGAISNRTVTKQKHRNVKDMALRRLQKGHLFSVSWNKKAVLPRSVSAGNVCTGWLRVLTWWQKCRQYQYRGHKYIPAGGQICKHRICKWWELTLGRIDLGFGKTSVSVLPCRVWCPTTCPLLRPLLTPSLVCSLSSFQPIYPTQFSAALQLSHVLFPVLEILSTLSVCRKFLCILQSSLQKSLSSGKPLPLSQPG